MQAQPQVPWTTLRGKSDNGEYNTAKAKEYPAGMCKAVALAFHDAYTYSYNSDSTLQLPHDNNFCEQVAELFVPLDLYLQMGLGQDSAEEAYRQQQ